MATSQAIPDQLPRVGIVSVWHETNTYSNRLTTLADFAAFELLEGSAVLEANRGTGTVVGGFCDYPGFELVPLLAAGAWPSGLVSADALDNLIQRLRRSLEHAGQVDGILLNLHGAMVAQGCLDADRRVIEAIREARADLPVSVVVDLHANLSQELVEACDVIISYDTFPHTDMRERGLEAAALLAELLGGRRLKTWSAAVPILVCPLAQATNAEPMAGLQRRAILRAAASGVRRVSVVGGFAYSDVERAGMSVLVVADEGSDDAIRSVLTETIKDIEEQRAAFVVVRPGVERAIGQALGSKGHPVFLVDTADNIGGGAPGDGTAILSELLRRRARGAIVTIADAEIAALTSQLGQGEELDALVGGKTDDCHGDPVRIQGVIRTVTDGRYRTSGSWMTGREFTMGKTAVIDVDGLTLVVTEKPTPPFHSEQLSSVGIDVRQARIVVVKGALAWRAAYGDLAAEVIEVDTPGICPVDPYRLARQSRTVGR